MDRGSADINYLILLLVVVLGVAGGNLLSNWITAQIVAYQARQAMEGLSQSVRGSPAPREDAAKTKIPMPNDLIRMQEERAREQRRRDREGVRLAQSCEEWRQADAQLKSYTTSTEMKKHCDVYERYVQHGVLAPRK